MFPPPPSALFFLSATEERGCTFKNPNYLRIWSILNDFLADKLTSGDKIAQILLIFN